jgi:hypothetical protein
MRPRWSLPEALVCSSPEFFAWSSPEVFGYTVMVVL